LAKAQTEQGSARVKSVADAIREGKGRYSFGNSIYLIVRGGSALWEYQFRQDGRLRTMGLGSAVARVPTEQPVTITDARAKRAAAWLARRNGEALPAGAAGKRFKQAAEDYLKAHATEWGPKQYNDHERRLRLHAAPLNSKPVNRITVDDVAGVLAPIWTGPNHGRGSKLRGLIELILNAEEVKQPTPAAWSRLQGKLSKKSVETKNYASLPYAELPALMTELERNESTQARAIRFIVLTGSRQMEALGAQWREFDLAEKIWTVPAARMKTRKPHVVTLSNAAIACLGRRGEDGDYVFPSRRGGHLGHASTGPILAEYRRTDKEGNPITLHGMRATFATWAQDQNFPPRVIDMALAHKEPDKVTEAYLRSELLPPRRKLIDAWGEFAISD
jgi:integrase